MTGLPLVALKRATVLSSRESVLDSIDVELFEGETLQLCGNSAHRLAVLLEVLAGRQRLTSGQRRYPAFEDEYPDARLGIPPRFAVRLVSSDEPRRLSATQSEYQQARWHNLWTEPLTVLDFLSPRRVLGIRPYEILSDLPVHRNYDLERQQTLDELELTGLEQRRVAQLSHGELHKLLLAAAHLANPRLLLLGDPLGGLDPGARTRLVKAFLRWRDQGQSLVLSSLNPNELTELASRHLVLSDGVLAQDGVLTQDGVLAQGRNVSPPQDRRFLPRPQLAESKCVVDCRNVTVTMGDVTLLEDVTWTVQAGEHWLVTGPNGSGKSTLLALLLGDHPQAYANDIRVFGKRLGSEVNLWERRRSIGAMAPELYFHYPQGLTLAEMVLSGFDGSIGLHRTAAAEESRVASARLEQFGLLALTDQPLCTLSDSEVRLGLLVRALVHRPQLLLLDEPTEGLDPPARHHFLVELERLAASGETTLVLVTHHVEQLPGFVTHRLELERGRVVRQGPC